jgi:hypothetical protein
MKTIIAHGQHLVISICSQSLIVHAKINHCHAIT